MLDNLGNEIHLNDTVIIPIKAGSTATLGRAFVKEMVKKPQFAGGAPSNMILVEWSNLSKLWFPSRNVINITSLLQKENKDGTTEAKQTT